MIFEGGGRAGKRRGIEKDQLLGGWKGVFNTIQRKGPLQLKLSVQTNGLAILCLLFKIFSVHNLHVYSTCYTAYFPFHVAVPSISKGTEGKDENMYFYCSF